MKKPISSPSLNSAIYEGIVTHHRILPRIHHFSYPLFHVYLDLAELDQVFSASRCWRHERSACASFRRHDFMPGALSLSDQVKTVVAERIAHRPTGAVRLLTHVRIFNISFNPVSFYYCFDRDNSLCAIVAEITNIPWLERHNYVLDCRNRSADDLTFTLDKAFHISPFMGMQQQYRWRFTVPGDELSVQMISCENDQPLFSASLAHHRKEMTATALDGLLWRYPFMPIQVVTAIYYQAARLWFKGVPTHNNPSTHSMNHTTHHTSSALDSAEITTPLHGSTHR